MQELLESLSLSKDAVALVSSLTALLAVLVGPIVQLIIGLRQQRATVVSGNRIRWIEEFRREAAEFVAACHLHEAERYWLAEAEDQRGDDRSEKQIEHYRKAVDASFFRVNTLRHTLRLRLDPDSPDRPDDREIWQRVETVDRLTVDDFPDLEAFERRLLEEVEPLLALIRGMLAREWEQVKRLK